MSNKVRVLAVAALALSLFLFSARTVAEEASDMRAVERERAAEAETLAADIEAVERELAEEAAAEARALAAEAKALALYERAKERAERAVKSIFARARIQEIWQRVGRGVDKVHHCVDQSE